MSSNNTIEELSDNESPIITASPVVLPVFASYSRVMETFLKVTANEVLFISLYHDSVILSLFISLGGGRVNVRPFVVNVSVISEVPVCFVQQVVKFDWSVESVKFES